MANENEVKAAAEAAEVKAAAEAAAKKAESETKAAAGTAGKKAITFVKDFTLLLQNGTTRTFKAGLHMLEAELHDHWYVKAHAAPAEQPGEAPAPAKTK